MTNWQITKASNFCLSVRDGTHDSPKRVNNGKYLITSRHIIGNKIDLTNAYQISNSDYEEVNRRSKVDRWDVLLTMIGTVGEVCLVKDEPNFAIKNIGLFKSKNELYGKWLYYFLQSKNVKQVLSSLKRGTTQEYIPLGELRNLNISYPTNIFEIQKIISILSSLDEKIENNLKMNDTLEEMARTIFKSWFVDFDPVHAKAVGEAAVHMDLETASLFPSSFGDNGLPEGWVNNELSNVCSLLGGYAFKSKEFVNEGMAIVKIKNITGKGDVSLKDCQFIDSKSTNGKDKFKLEDGDLLIAMTGATVGKTGIITDGKSTPYLNQRVGKFIPKQSFYKWAIWAYLQFKKNVDAVVATGTGSAQTNISSTGIMSVKWTEAPHEIYKVFDKIVSPYFNLWISNIHQNQTLTELRDTLLSKLMSGEICVKDAEREVEAVI